MVSGVVVSGMVVSGGSDVSGIVVSVGSVVSEIVVSVGSVVSGSVVSVGSVVSGRVVSTGIVGSVESIGVAGNVVAADGPPTTAPTERDSDRRGDGGAPESVQAALRAVGVGLAN